MTETDPNGLDAKQPGAKLDAGKPPLLRGCLQYFRRALTEVSRVSEVGAKKYSWKGWEKVPDGINRYGEALTRHLAADESIDKDTGLRHAAQVAWNALARLELILRGEEVEKAQTEEWAKHIAVPPPRKGENDPIQLDYRAKPVLERCCTCGVDLLAPGAAHTIGPNCEALYPSYEKAPG